MSALAFVDTETTSLLPSRRAWEFACIRREEDGREERLEMFISAPLDEADPMSLRFAKFYERHPDYRLSEPDAIGGWDEQTAARFIERITRSAVLVGSNPAFDAATLAPLLRRHALIESWHYAVRDIVPLMVGYLTGRGEPVPSWKSEELSRAVGVDPDDYPRHTAMGDVEWTRAVYDAVMGGAR